MEHQQKNCVITGVSGATSGLIETYLLNQGFTVIGTLRPNKISADPVKINANHYHIGMDPLELGSIQNAIHKINTEIGSTHTWINVIGGFEMGAPIEQTADDSWKAMWQMNFSTVLNTTQVILPYFKAAKTGRLINFGSAAVEGGMALAGPYLVSKAAVHTLTKVTAAELDDDITCNAILPGVIDTPANRQTMPDADFSQWDLPTDIARKIVSIIEGNMNGELIKL